MAKRMDCSAGCSLNELVSLVECAGALLWTGARLHRALRFRMPVLVIAQKETLPVSVQCRVQE